jgi:hypothetical protein
VNLKITDVQNQRLYFQPWDHVDHGITKSHDFLPAGVLDKIELVFWVPGDLKLHPLKRLKRLNLTLE